MNYFPSKMTELTHQLNGYQKLQNTLILCIYIYMCVLFTGIHSAAFQCVWGQTADPWVGRERTIWVVLYIAEHINGTQTHVFYLWLSGLGKKGGVFHKQNINPKQGIRAKLSDHSGQLLQIFNIIKPLPSRCICFVYSIFCTAWVLFFNLSPYL